jgi:hypothetical protein
MQVLHDRAAPQVKEVLADASIARPTPLPVADVGQPMLHRHPFAQLSAPQRGQLPLAQLLWMDDECSEPRSIASPMGMATRTRNCSLSLASIPGCRKK